VPEGATVLDLGCGDGQLLEELIVKRRVQGSGVDISQAAIEACIARGLPVYHGDLDEGLQGYADESLDVVVLSLSLQQLRRPRMVVREMVRVGRLAIVSFPNFAHWSLRSQLFFRGRMPVSKDLPFQWWDTPNIHLCTMRDFRTLCDEEGLSIEREIALRALDRPPTRLRLPNLTARIAIFSVRRGQSSGRGAPAAAGPSLHID
jgi:methionine biosynthesis protein MetW